jgi:hypothetical protein
LIEDVESGVNIELMFVGRVPADAAETPFDGTFATAMCTNKLPALDKKNGRYGKVKCIVNTKGFSIKKRARRQTYAEDGRPGITIGTRTWIVIMLQIPGEHKITEAERLEVSRERAAPYSTHPQLVCVAPQSCSATHSLSLPFSSDFVTMLMLDVATACAPDHSNQVQNKLFPSTTGTSFGSATCNDRSVRTLWCNCRSCHLKHQPILRGSAPDRTHRVSHVHFFCG